MKLLEINPIEFLHYGRFGSQAGNDISQNPDYRTEIVTPSNTATSQLSQYDDEVFLEPLDGVGVLFVEDPQQGGIKMFLLDKNTVLKKELWFCILPYQCEFRYLIKHKQPPRTRSIDDVLTAQGIYPHMKVDRLYTVMYQERNKSFNFKGERHPYWEMTYMDTGSMICRVEQEDIVLKQGDVLLFTPNQFHSQRAENGKPFSFFTVSFDLNFSDEEMFRSKSYKATLSMHRLMKEILAEYQQEALYSNEMMIAALTQLLIILIREAKNTSPFAAIPSNISLKIKNEMIGRCLKIIDDNIANKITVDFLARQLSVSASYLGKLFRSEVGSGISEYIKERRLEQAKYLIQTGSYTITQVSDMLGYCSGCYFSTEFKKRYNLTPSEYSKSITL